MKKNYIGIREARINLSKLIRDVSGGMEIIITDRGKPVARLIKAKGYDLSLEERIKNYESCGLIEPSAKQGKETPSPIDIPRDYAMRCIEEERGDE